jgi:hypothetical protein
LESDAYLVKIALEGDEYRLSALGGIVTELRLLRMSEFVDARVQICPRSCNKVADALAAFGCKYPSDDLITWETVPRFVEELVTSDLAESNE